MTNVKVDETGSVVVSAPEVTVVAPAVEFKAQAVVVNAPANDQISFEDFAKVELKFGTVVEAAPVPKSNKLLSLSVDFGETSMLAVGPAVPADLPTVPVPRYRRVLAGVGKTFKPEDLVGKQFLFVTNLPPREMMGFRSEGMLLAVGDNPETLNLIRPNESVKPGSRAK